MRLLLAQARRLVVAVVGLTVLLVGVAMTVLPGPAIVVIPLGLAILATEFVWAQRLLKRAKDTANGARERMFGAATCGEENEQRSSCSADAAAKPGASEQAAVKVEDAA